MKTTVSKFIFSISLVGLILISSEVLFSQPFFPFQGSYNNPVLTKSINEWDHGCVLLAYPIYVDGTYYLFYTGSVDNPMVSPVAIGYATSSDGVDFEKHLGPILEGDGTGFDSYGVSHSIVIKEDDVWKIYYNANIGPTLGPGENIGLATTTNLDSMWTREDNPVLSVGSSGEWDGGCIDPNSILKVDSGYIMYYFGASALPVSDGSIGMAFSADGIIWEKYNDPLTIDPPYAESDPVLVPGEPGTWDERTFWGCSVLKLGSNFEMFYAGMDNSQNCGIGYAISADGITWEKHYTIYPYTYLDDPYASVYGYTIMEFPGVIKNADSSLYLMYYDYGPPVGEISMAIADVMIGINFLDHNNSISFRIYPNPFSSSTTIEFDLEETGRVEIEIVNQFGQEVDRMVHSGHHGINKVVWDAGSLPAGVYMCRVKACNRIVTRKMVKL